MPSATLKGLAAKHNIDLSTLEGWWAEARKEYGTDYKAVMGTLMTRIRNHAHARASTMEKG